MCAQPVTFDPTVNLTVFLDLALDLLQRQELGVKCRKLTLQGLQALLCRRTVRLNPGARALDLRQNFALPAQFRVTVCEVLLESCQVRRVRGQQFGPLGEQALIARKQPLQYPVRMREVGLLELNPSLFPGYSLPMLGKARLRVAIRLFRFGKPCGLVAETLGRRDRALPRLRSARLPHVRRFPQFG